MEARKAHYAGVLEKRGEAARNELIAEVNRQWALGKGLSAIRFPERLGTIT